MKLNRRSVAQSWARVTTGFNDLLRGSGVTIRKFRTRAVVIGGLLVSGIGIVSSALPLGSAFGAIVDGSWGDARPVTGVDSAIFRERLVGRADPDSDFVGRINTMRYSWRSHRRRASGLLADPATRRAGLALLAENATTSERMLELVVLAGEVDIEIQVEAFEAAIAFDKDKTLRSLTCASTYVSLVELGREDLITQCVRQTGSRELAAIISDSPLSEASKVTLANLAGVLLQACQRAIAPPHDYSNCKIPVLRRLSEPYFVSLDNEPSRLGTILRYVFERLSEGKGVFPNPWAKSTPEDAERKWRQEEGSYRELSSAILAACRTLRIQLEIDETECAQVDVDDWIGITTNAYLASAPDESTLIKRALQVSRTAGASKDPERVWQNIRNVQKAKSALLAIARSSSLRTGEITPDSMASAIDMVPGLQLAYLEVKSIESAFVTQLSGADLIDALEDQAKSAAEVGMIREAEATIARGVSVAAKSVNTRRAIDLEETLAEIYGDYHLLDKQLEALKAAHKLATGLKLQRTAGSLEIETANATIRAGEKDRGIEMFREIAERWRANPDGHIESNARINLLANLRGSRTNAAFQDELKRAKSAAQRVNDRYVHAEIAFWQSYQALFDGAGDTERVRLAKISADLTSQSPMRRIRVDGHILLIAELLVGGKDADACLAAKGYLQGEDVPEIIPKSDREAINEFLLPVLSPTPAVIDTRQKLMAIFAKKCSLTA